MKRPILFALVTTAFAGLLLSAAPVAAEETSDLDAWETQVLGAIFGTFCGYYPNRVTVLGKQIGLKGYAQCKQLFDDFAPKCLGKIKTEGRYHIASEEEGSALGEEIGRCIGTRYDQLTQAAPPPPAA